ncbi:MAG: UbiA family prenyltransferase [Aureispira sp.]
MLAQLLFYLKVSRPGLWFATLWLYLLPTSQMTDIYQSWPFWYGLFYVCFPLNFLVYGWNDMVDYETDALNPRKDSFWFGARGSKEQLQVLWRAIAFSQVLFFPALIWAGGWKVALFLLLFTIINGLYNLPERGLRSHPPLELLCQVGYLLVVPLSIWVNQLEGLPWQTYLYLFLFAMQSHIMGEVMDIVPDTKAGRKTTGTVLGTKRTKLLIIGIVFLEVTLLFSIYQEYIFGGLLALGLFWLLLDVLVIYKDKPYTILEMKLFALMSNVVAVMSMAYVWWSGCLLQIAS